MLKKWENVLSIFQAQLQYVYKHRVLLILLKICAQMVH